MEISDASYPSTMASTYANKAMGKAGTLLNNQMTRATSTAGALSSLRQALESFQSALDGLGHRAGGLLANATTSSDNAVASAVADSSGVPGSYAFHVEALASNHQLTSAAIGTTASATAGTLALALADGSTFEVDLAGADGDVDGLINAAEIARAINIAAAGKVNVSTLTLDGEQRLVLNAGIGGDAGRITLDARRIGDGALAAALSGARETSAASNAVFHLGGVGGTRIEQGSNAFSGITGLQVDFRGLGDVRLDVGRDDTATTANVQAFVDAHNRLHDVLAALTRPGDLVHGDAGGAFAADSGVQALARRLGDLLRQPVGGRQLATLGVATDRDGRLHVDSGRLLAALKADAAGIGAVIGNGSNGISGAMSQYLQTWLASGNGLLKHREESAQQVQKELNNRKVELDQKYDRLHQRYLLQFTTVQTLDNHMKHTLDLLDALLGERKR